jgi:acetyl esterase/lipase
MAATHYSQSFVAGEDTSGLHPDFLILAWPVVSFRPELVHKGSMKNLLGDKPSEEDIAFYSPNEWVDETTPPTFLVHAADDASVPVGNSICFFEALKKSNVPAELHIYESGGHGFGVAPDVQDSWISQLELWLRKRNLTGNNELSSNFQKL